MMLLFSTTPLHIFFLSILPKRAVSFPSHVVYHCYASFFYVSPFHCYESKNNVDHSAEYLERGWWQLAGLIQASKYCT